LRGGEICRIIRAWEKTACFILLRSPPPRPHCPDYGDLRGHYSLPSARSSRSNSSCEITSPRSISSSPARMSSRISSVSVSSYGEAASQSMMLTNTDVGLPFCVTMMGRCVRRVFSIYSPSLLRHSVKDMTSSERIGRRGPGRSARRAVLRTGARVFAGIYYAPFVDANSVPCSVRCAQWA